MSIKSFDKFLIFTVILIMCLPSIGSILGYTPQADNFEGRTYQPFPNLSNTNLVAYPKALKDFFDSNFGFRNLIIRKTMEIRLAVYSKFLINKPSTFGLTVIGKDGWYFLHAKDIHLKTNFSDEELEFIQEKIERENDWFLQKDIPFILLIVPDKETVYTEYNPLPNTEAATGLDRFMNYMKVNSKVSIIDLRNTFNLLKKDYPLYYRTDTHWTNFGAFIAYSEIMKKLKEKNPAVYIPQLSDFDIKEKVYRMWRGDLGLPLNVDKKAINISIQFTPKLQLLNKEKLTKVLVKGDSYTSLTHYIKRYSFIDMFPEMKNQLDLIFKAPEVVGMFDSKQDLQLKDTPDNTIEIIKNNIGDKSLQNRLINYLFNSLAVDDEMIGLRYFLPFSFKYIAHDPHPNNIVFDHEIVEEEKPDLVIYEIVQRNMERFLISEDSY